MKTKTIIALALVAVLIAACSSAAPMVEMTATESVPEETVMETTQPAAADGSAVMDEPTAAADGAASAEATISFSQDVWPILEKYALAAHGGKGGVFLESYDDVMNYVVPGDPENSRLYKALTGNGERLMPPDGPLPDEMIQIFYDWIAQGALNN